MTKDERDVLVATEVGDPVPGEDTFYGNDNIVTIWSNGLQEDIWISLDVSVQDDLSFLCEDAKIHRPGVKIDAAVKFVLLGVKSHLRPPYGKIGFLNHTCFGYGSGGP